MSNARTACWLGADDIAVRVTGMPRWRVRREHVYLSATHLADLVNRVVDVAFADDRYVLGCLAEPVRQIGCGVSAWPMSCNRRAGGGGLVDADEV
ncbi:hypothetical protein, partial [Streptomyces sp. NPDC005125]